MILIHGSGDSSCLQTHAEKANLGSTRPTPSSAQPSESQISQVIAPTRSKPSLGKMALFFLVIVRVPYMILEILCGLAAGRRNHFSMLSSILTGSVRECLGDITLGKEYV